MAPRFGAPFRNPDFLRGFYLVFLFLPPHMFSLSFTTSLVAAFTMDVQHGQDVVDTVAPPTASGQTVAGSGRLKGSPTSKRQRPEVGNGVYSFRLRRRHWHRPGLLHLLEQDSTAFSQKGGGVKCNTNSLKKRFNNGYSV
jgi:hypothetical protein